MEPVALAMTRAKFADLATRCAGLRAEAARLCQRSENVRGRAADLVSHASVRWPATPLSGLADFGAQRGPALRCARLASSALPRGTSLATRRRPRLLPMAGGAGAEAILCHYLVATCLGPGKQSLDRDEPLLANGILDSLGVLRLTAFVEETFGVAVPDDALTPEHFGTLRRLTTFVEHLEEHARVLQPSGRARR